MLEFTFRDYEVTVADSKPLKFVVSNRKLHVIVVFTFGNNIPDSLPRLGYLKLYLSI